MAPDNQADDDRHAVDDLLLSLVTMIVIMLMLIMMIMMMLGTQWIRMQQSHAIIV